MAAEQFVFTVDKNQRKEKRRKIAAVSRTVRVLNLLGIIINIAAAAFILIWGGMSETEFVYTNYDGKEEKDLLVLIFVSMKQKKDNQPPAGLGLNYFREER